MAAITIMVTMAQRLVKLVLSYFINKKALGFYVVICSSLISIYSAQVKAADWKFSPELSVEYAYTDNIDLSNDNKSSEAIFSVTPGITLGKEGGQLDLAFFYNTQIVRYRDNTQANDEYHSGGINAALRVVPNVFQIKMDASHGQQAVSLTSSPVPQDNIFISDNRANVTTYRITPILTKRLSAKIKLDADYTYEGFIVDDSTTDDNTRNTIFHARLSSGERDNQLFWSLDYNKREYDIRSDTDNSDTRTEASLGYWLTPRFALMASAGDEESNIQGSLLGSGDTFWRVGIEWRPNTRTDIKLSHDERFYGDSDSASISYKGKRNNFSLGYTEEITTISSIQIHDNTLPTSPLIPLQDDFVLQKALNVLLSGSTARLTYGVSLNARKLTFLTTLERQNYGSSTIFGAWKIGHRSSVRLSATRQKTKFIASNSEEVLDNQEIRFVREIGRQINMSLNYSRYENESSTGTNEYKSNFYGFQIDWKQE
jgi:hypothetical protein